MRSEKQNNSLIKTVITILAASVIQISAGWFLLSNIVFADSHPNLIESILYFLLVLTPYAATLAVYIKTARAKQAVLLGILGYFASAVILTLAPLINGFYVTGVGGVGLVSLSVMTVHLIILLFTLKLLKINREVGRTKIELKNFAIAFLCVAVSLFFIGFFKTLAWNTEPNSYLALGYLDLKDLAAGIGESLFMGLLSVILDLRILGILTAYSVLIYILLGRVGKHLNFSKKILVIFVPIWIVIALFVAMSGQTLKQGLHDNFINFQPTWDNQSLITNHKVELSGVSFTVWCDTTLDVSDQSIECKNRYTVLPTDRLRTPRDTYSKQINVGLFEEVAIQSNTTTECVYTENDIQIDNAFFTLKTEWCDSRNFPVMASIEWEEFVLPVIECFGFDKCETTQ